MITIDVTVKGLCPLLQAKHPTPDEEAEILKRLKDTKLKLKDLTESEKFNMHVYKQDGKFVQPGEMFEAMMIKAATRIKMEGKKTYKDAFKGGVVVEQEMITHKCQKFDAVHQDSDKKVSTVWHMDARWGRNPTTRGAMWVVRPRLDEWELSFTINLLLDDVIPTSVVKDALTYGGMYIGIGAWRPKFGTFEVTKFVVNKSK
jgi:hypothetical protein